MSLPALSASRPLRAASPSASGRPLPLARGVAPQSCSGAKKVACGAAFLACGASCYFGPEVCIPCLGAVGAGADCLNCLLDW